MVHEPGVLARHEDDPRGSKVKYLQFVRERTNWRWVHPPFDRAVDTADEIMTLLMKGFPPREKSGGGSGHFAIYDMHEARRLRVQWDCRAAARGGTLQWVGCDRAADRLIPAQAGGTHRVRRRRINRIARCVGGLNAAELRDPHGRQ